MSKYIIEIAEEYEEYFKGVLICGIADGKFAVDVIAREDLEELNSDYINEHYGELQDEAYQKGFEEGRNVGIKDGMCEAWEVMKKIALGPEDGALATHQLKEIFGTYFVSEIIRERTAQEVIDKLKAYEDKHSNRIEVGDIVDAYGKIGVVTYAYKNTFNVMMYDGSTGRWRREDLKKTGKHYDIASILEAMRK